MDTGKITQVIVSNGKTWDATHGSVFTTTLQNQLVTGICVRLSPLKTVTIPAQHISGIVIEYASAAEVDAIFARPA